VKNIWEGVYKIEFDGSGFSSGVYFYQLKTGEYIETKKMILLSLEISVNLNSNG